MEEHKKRCAAPDETDSAVEKLLLKKNGSRTTMVDLKELLIAVNHDSRARDLWLCQLLEDHCEVQYHVTKPEFDAIVAKFAQKHERRDKDVEALKEELDEVRQTVVGDEEIGDLRRAWRVGRWFIAALVLVGLDLVARYLSTLIDNIPT